MGRIAADPFYQASFSLAVCAEQNRDTIITPRLQDLQIK